MNRERPPHCCKDIVTCWDCLALVLRNPSQPSQPQAIWALGPGRYGGLVEDVNWQLKEHPQHSVLFLFPCIILSGLHTWPSS